MFEVEQTDNQVVDFTRPDVVDHALNSPLFNECVDKGQVNLLSSYLDTFLPKLQGKETLNPDMLDEIKAIFLSLAFNQGPYFSFEQALLIAGNLAVYLKQHNSESRPLNSQMSVNDNLSITFSLEGTKINVVDTANPGSLYLQITRQDNSDKPPYTRYRVRQVRGDEVSTQWWEKPNYWSEKMQEALRITTAKMNQKLKGKATVYSITEGGVFKGTGAPHTDSDTTFVAIVNTSDPVEQLEIAREINAMDREWGAELDFPVKSYESGVYVHDAQTGEEYSFGLDRLMKRNSPLIQSDGLHHLVRKHEQGFIVSDGGNHTKVVKPDEDKDRDWRAVYALSELG
jgi:hypothetical protein